jgi:chorismate mutase
MESIIKESINMNKLIKKHGLVIAGPCSAESEEQLLQTALELHSEGKTDVLRAGIWKPRTNPGSFEGVGTKGLSWLLKAKQITGLPVAVEVATGKHVEDALSFETDILWIGARSTVNPFSVQNIADALKGTKQTVLIKNPVNADIKLWIGAIERLQKSGIDSIGLIHRGFTSYGNTEYRNVPMWQIPIEMKRLFPGLPVICDPSHICGNTKGLLSVAQKSVELDYSGLIIESHCAPETALTDKAQQVKPKELSLLLDSIVWKKASSEESDFVTKLDRLREQINYLDEELITLISNRMTIAKEIGQIKKDSKVTILQSSRYNEVVQRALTKGKQLELSEEFIKHLMEGIHIESIRTQNTLI